MNWLNIFEHSFYKDPEYCSRNWKTFRGKKALGKKIPEKISFATFGLMGNLYSAVDKLYFPIYLIQHYKYSSKIGVSPTCGIAY